MHSLCYPPTLRVRANCHDNYIDIVPRQPLMLHRTMRRRPSQNRVQPGLSEGTCNDPFEMNIADDAPLIAAGPQPIVATARAWLARLQARLGRLDASWRVRRQWSREV